MHRWTRSLWRGEAQAIGPREVEDSRHYGCRRSCPSNRIMGWRCNEEERQNENKQSESKISRAHLVLAMPYAGKKVPEMTGFTNNRVGMKVRAWYEARSGFAYAEDGGSAVGADTFDGCLAVFERDVLRVLYLHACLALYAVCLWHILLI